MTYLSSVVDVVDELQRIIQFIDKVFVNYKFSISRMLGVFKELSSF